MKIKKTINRYYWVISNQFGVDIRRLYLGLAGIPRFLADFYKFSRNYKGKVVIKPCLHDRGESAGVMDEYFYQDLLVAEKIYKNNPKKHVDIGSRIDGFVAHVAAFRPIEVFDIRGLESDVEHIKFKKMDLMDDGLVDDYREYCDSISCLHAIEHFGLGRYSDPIRVDGPSKGLENIAKILKPGGHLYISTPIGTPRVEYNANYIFDPFFIYNKIVKHNFQLSDYITFNPITKKLKYYDGNIGYFHALVHENYHLGIFTFKKLEKID